MASSSPSGGGQLKQGLSRSSRKSRLCWVSLPQDQGDSRCAKSRWLADFGFYKNMKRNNFRLLPENAEKHGVALRKGKFLRVRGEESKSYVGAGGEERLKVVAARGEKNIPLISG